MTILLALAAVVFGFLLLSFTLWFYYVQVMGMMAARDAGRIPPEMLRLCQIVLFVGLVFDVLYNVTIGTLIFLDPPREATLTARLVRYKKQGGWRGKVAQYICSNLLDPFDPSGCHCNTN